MMFPNSAIIGNNNSEWLTVAEAAILAGVDRATLWRWTRSGRIPARRRGLRTLEIPRAAIEALRAPRAPAAADLPAKRHPRGREALACPVKGCGWSCGTPTELAVHLVADHGPTPGRPGRPAREGMAPRCSARGCKTPARARGLCWKHYQAARRRKGRL